MADPAIVQSNAGASEATDNVRTFSSSVTPGNYVLVCLGRHTGNAGDSTPTDNKGNTYNLITGIGFGNETVRGWLAKVETGGTSFAVTVPCSSGKAYVSIHEISGLDPTTPLTVAVATGSGSSATPSAGTITPSGAANSIVIAWAIQDNTISAVPSGFTQIANVSYDFRNMMAGANVTNAATGTDFTGSSGAWAAMAISLNPAPSITAPTITGGTLTTGTNILYAGNANGATCSTNAGISELGSQATLSGATFSSVIVQNVTTSFTGTATLTAPVPPGASISAFISLANVNGSNTGLVTLVNANTTPFAFTANFTATDANNFSIANQVTASTFNPFLGIAVEVVTVDGSTAGVATNGSVIVVSYEINGIESAVAPEWVFLWPPGGVFPPTDNFDYDAGSLVGQGGWEAGDEGSPRIVSSGVVVAGTSGQSTAVHSVTTSGLTTTSLWDLSADFFLSDESYLSLNLFLNRTDIGYAQITLNAGTDGNFNFIQIIDEATDFGVGTLTVNASHTTSLRAVADEVFQLLLDGVVISTINGALADSLWESASFQIANLTTSEASYVSEISFTEYVPPSAQATSTVRSTIQISLFGTNTETIGASAKTMTFPGLTGGVYNDTLTNGTSSGEANLLASVQGTITVGTPYDINLRNIPAAGLENPVALTGVKALLIQSNTSSGSNTLLMGDSSGTLTNAWTLPWTEATGQNKVMGGGAGTLINPLGYVVDSSRKILRLEAIGGTVVFQLDIIGTG